jgi:hypothetical protein
MSDVIQRSLNTGVIFVLKALGGNVKEINLEGKKLLHDYISDSVSGWLLASSRPGNLQAN